MVVGCGIIILQLEVPNAIDHFQRPKLMFRLHAEIIILTPFVCIQYYCDCSDHNFSDRLFCYTESTDMCRRLYRSSVIVRWYERVYTSYKGV